MTTHFEVLEVAYWEAEEPGVSYGFGQWRPFNWLLASPETLLMRWPDYGRGYRVRIEPPDEILY